MTALLIRLYFEFFKTGLFSIGGGLATLPFLKEIGESTGWFTSAELMNMLSVSESTPGPIGINMATYVGFTVAGIPGALAATLGEVSPCIIIILIIGRMLKHFKDSSLVQHAFYGLRPASTALIGSALLSVVFKVMTCIKEQAPAAGSVIKRFSVDRNLPFLNIPLLLLAGVIYVLTNHIKKTKGLHPLVFIAFSALCGILLRMSGA